MELNLVAPGEAIGPLAAVNCLSPATLLSKLPPTVFLYLFILRDFKSNNLVTADSKGLASHFFVSAYSKGLTNMDERQGTAPPNGNEPVSENRDYHNKT